MHQVTKTIKNDVDTQKHLKVTKTKRKKRKTPLQKPKKITSHHQTKPKKKPNQKPSKPTRSTHP